MKTALRYLLMAPVFVSPGAVCGASSGHVLFAVDAVEPGSAIRAEWTGPVAVSRERDTGRAWLVLERTRHGSFAEAAIESSPIWAEAGVLETVVEVTTHGIVSAKLVETEAEGREGWVASARLAPGRHILRWRLRAEPDGDLRRATPLGDGIWNPGEEGIRRLRIGFSGGGMTVRSIRLLPAER